MPLLGTATHKYKRWDAGRVPHLSSTYAKNSYVSTGMSKDMTQKFNFMKIAESSFVDVTDNILAQ
jgi:hypothetical protein